MLHIYDTRARALVPFSPITPGQVSLYVCGMTVYDDAHVGHARSAVIFDTVARYLRWRGYAVRYVRNFTDIDDKIIRRAHTRGEPPADLAARQVRRYQEDMAALGLLPPTVEPRVSDHIGDIVDLISTLVARGHAYAADGSVWFSVRSDPEYGTLSNQSPDQLQGGEVDHGKRAAEDFALWKGARPGEPSWESPWGPGRPGWHIECSAMSVRHLGPTFDIHGGGLDLVFPHHENERAQSERAGHPYARHWMHHGMLTVRGGKMGHSLGNFVTVRDTLGAYPAEALRLYYLQGHYRSPLPYDQNALDRALAMTSRLYEALSATEAPPPNSERHPEVDALLALAEGFPERLREVMDQDFNTAAALAEAFTLARAVNRIAQSPRLLRRAGVALSAAREAFRVFSAATGLLQQEPADFAAEVKRKRIAVLGLQAADIASQVSARSAARAARDWSRADAIRASLREQGIEVRDAPDGGSDWHILMEDS